MEVIEARISYLAYSPEIAQAMLQIADGDMRSSSRSDDAGERPGPPRVQGSASSDRRRSMLVHALTTRLVNRHVVRRLARAIPHPGARAVAMVLCSVLVSRLVEKEGLARAARVSGRWPLISRRVPAAE